VGAGRAGRGSRPEGGVGAGRAGRGSRPEGGVGAILWVGGERRRLRARGGGLHGVLQGRSCWAGRACGRPGKQGRAPAGPAGHAGCWGSRAWVLVGGLLAGPGRAGGQAAHKAILWQADFLPLFLGQHAPLPAPFLQAVIVARAQLAQRAHKLGVVVEGCKAPVEGAWDAAPGAALCHAVDGTGPGWRRGLPVASHARSATVAGAPAGLLRKAPWTALRAPLHCCPSPRAPLTWKGDLHARRRHAHHSALPPDVLVIQLHRLAHLQCPAAGRGACLKEGARARGRACWPARPRRPAAASPLAAAHVARPRHRRRRRRRRSPRPAAQRAVPAP